MNKDSQPTLSFSDVQSIFEKKGELRSRSEIFMLTEYLKQVPSLTSKCSKNEQDFHLSELARFIELEEFKQGEAVFHKGEISTHFYFIIQGAVAVFISKSLQEMDLEEKWKVSLVQLADEIERIKCNLVDKVQLYSEDIDIETKKQIREQIQILQSQVENVSNQITFGKNILNYLKNPDDEQILRNLNEAKYFRGEKACQCTFKKVEVLKQNQSFGESILSTISQQRTATIVALEGDHQQRQIFLGKVEKSNFLRVFQKELEKRNALKRALMDQYKKDISDKVLNILTFQFKEQYLDKNIYISKQFDQNSDYNDEYNSFLFEQTPKNNSKISFENNGEQKRSKFMNEHQQKKDQEDGQEKQSQEATPKMQYLSGDDSLAKRKAKGDLFSYFLDKEEHLYFLYKGQIEIQVKSKEINDVQQKDQKHEIVLEKEQLLQNNIKLLRHKKKGVSNKLDIGLARLTEGEFFGHENWFMEDIDKIIKLNGMTMTPEQIFKERMAKLKKDFSIMVAEIDTIIFKIPRKFLLEEQNHSLLFSLVAHGQMKYNRYCSLAKQAIEKEQTQGKYELKQAESKGPIDINIDKQISRRAFINIEKQLPSQNKRQSHITEQEEIKKVAASIAKTQEFKEQFNLFRNKFDADYNFSVSQFKKGKDAETTYAEFKVQQQQLENQPRSSSPSKRNSQIWRIKKDESMFLQSQKMGSTNSFESNNVPNQSGMIKKSEVIIPSIQALDNLQMEEKLGISPKSFSNNQEETGKSREKCFVPFNRQQKTMSLHDLRNIKKEEENERDKIESQQSASAFKRYEQLEWLKKRSSLENGNGNEDCDLLFQRNKDIKQSKLETFFYQNYYSPEQEDLSPILIKTISKPRDYGFTTLVQDTLPSPSSIQRINSQQRQLMKSSLINLNKVQDKEEDVRMTNQSRQASQDFQMKRASEPQLLAQDLHMKTQDILQQLDNQGKDQFSRDSSKQQSLSEINKQKLKTLQQKVESSREIKQHIQDLCLLPTTQTKLISQQILKQTLSQRPLQRLHTRNTFDTLPRNQKKGKQEIRPHEIQNLSSSKAMEAKRCQFLKGNPTASFNSFSYRTIKEGTQSQIITTIDTYTNFNKTSSLFHSGVYEKGSPNLLSPKVIQEDLNKNRERQDSGIINSKSIEINLRNKEKEFQFPLNHNSQQQKNPIQMKRELLLKRSFQQLTERQEISTNSRMFVPQQHFIKNCFNKK